mmetsp:Transcript_36616/g.59207  ORF Transcript_36616/g.59207 Transcript_36616/m.59207 type:complete len:134 (+) Transcript_36616:161-562(+)
MFGVNKDNAVRDSEWLLLPMRFVVVVVLVPVAAVTAIGVSKEKEEGVVGAAYWAAALSKARERMGVKASGVMRDVFEVVVEEVNVSGVAVDEEEGVSVISEVGDGVPVVGEEVRLTMMALKESLEEKGTGEEL